MRNGRIQPRGKKPSSSRHGYIPRDVPEFDHLRKEDDKLPSFEAMQAYAVCTNNPINDDEEIILRTIDLLIAMGQRGNEITVIPYDCWLELTRRDHKGAVVTDMRGKPIIDVGIRYYAEKQFQSRVHWLAEQDIPLARRAVERLKKLTREVRKTAKWQEENPGRLWEFCPEEKLFEEDLLEMLGFADRHGLYLFLCEQNGVAPLGERARKGHAGGRRNKRYYKAGDIEALLIPGLGDHLQACPARLSVCRRI